MDTEKLVRDIVANVMSRVDPDGTGAAVKSPVNAAGSQKGPRKVVCGVSVRHIHLCPEHVEVLFGKGYEMQIKTGVKNEKNEDGKGLHTH